MDLGQGTDGSRQRIQHNRLMNRFGVTRQCRLDDHFLNIDIGAENCSDLRRQSADYGRLYTVTIDQAWHFYTATFYQILDDPMIGTLP